VFGSPDAELLIMVSGDADAVEAFAPKLDEWTKSFKQP
jgi:3-hydroxyisobutyrate dehydrogenase-like beta-hydroxyacid dehydrogenase